MEDLLGEVKAVLSRYPSLNRVGFHDDIFTLEYSTPCFQDSQALVGSYEAPILDIDRLRLRLSGSWSEYQASEVGVANMIFEGKSWTAGGDLILNVESACFLCLETVSQRAYVGQRILTVDRREDIHGIRLL